jgi:hypothetical protein
MFAFWLSISFSLRIEPNGNIPTINENSVVCGPIGCTVDFRGRLLHLEIILMKKPLRIALCNKAFLLCKQQNAPSNCGAFLWKIISL